VSKNIPDGEAWFGYPARPMMRAKRIESVISKLPEIYKELDKLLGEKKNV
jgi:UDP-3-O-[3-hydroxymyristoyl] glucosamine N-acyltransferase